MTNEEWLKIDSEWRGMKRRVRRRERLNTLKGLVVIAGALLGTFLGLTSPPLGLQFLLFPLSVLGLCLYFGRND
jgi:hypothetical protein